MPTQVSLLDGALASAGTLAIQTNGTTSAITISSAQVATFVNNPIMTGLTASRAVFTDGSKGLTSNAITGTGNVVMSASPTLTGTIDGAALTLSSSLTLSGGTANGVLYLNGSKVATSGSALTFDGTNFNVVRSAATDQYMSLYADGTGPTFKFFGGAAGKIALLVADSASARMQFQNDGDKPFVYSINGSEQMRLTSTGLGIGTSSPTNALTVGTTSAGKNIAIYSSSNGNNGLLRMFDLGGTERLQLSANSTGEAVYYAPTGSVHAWYVNTERMRLDSSGNLGLGVTPSAWSGQTALQTNGGSLATSNTSTLNLTQNAFYNGTSWTRVNALAASMLQQSGGAFNFFTAGSSTAGSAITFTQAMTLDASGRLGIGTTSPNVALHVAQTSSLIKCISTGDNAAYTEYQANNSGVPFYVGQDSSSGGSFGKGGYAAVLWQTGAYPLIFTTSNAERARITSGGVLLVNTTNANPSGSGSAGQVVINTLNGGQSALTCYNAGTSAVNIISLENGNGQVGRIQVNGTATSYLTSSDYRLKEDVQPMTGALAKVQALKPCTFKWKVDGTSGQGFIAHELQEVCPDAVGGEKDAVNAEGNPVYQGIDTSFLVATLTAALQEAVAEINSLKARLDAANL